MEIIALNFILVFLMSFLFGIERQLSNKSAGFGTFIFVAIGSCALGSLSLTLSPDNILVIVGGVVTGIGFLGAGALIKTSDKIFGFTTSASIWIFSIIGLAIGLEQYWVGSIMYFIVWGVVITDKFLESKGIGSYQRKITLLTKGIIDKKEIINLFKPYKWKLLSTETDKDNKKMNIIYLISCPRNYVGFLTNKLVKIDWIKDFKIE
jgi:putative Mg2+ transporter-C (MgtC) family protein